MKDLDADGIALFKSLCGAQYIDPVITEKTTPAGNMYIQVFSNEGSEIMSYVTLFEGYMIQIDYYHQDFSKLTDEDHAFAEEILHGIWINELLSLDRLTRDSKFRMKEKPSVLYSEGFLHKEE